MLWRLTEDEGQVWPLGQTAKGPRSRSHGVWNRPEPHARPQREGEEDGAGKTVSAKWRRSRKLRNRSFLLSSLVLCMCLNSSIKVKKKKKAANSDR